MHFTEAQIQKQVLEYLTLRGHFAFRVNTMGVPMWDGKSFKGFRPSPMKGVADILGVRGKPARGVPAGQAFAIEVKDKKGKPSKEQVAFLEEVNRKGGLGIVARSIEDVQSAGL